MKFSVKSLPLCVFTQSRMIVSGILVSDLHLSSSKTEPVNKEGLIRQDLMSTITNIYSYTTCTVVHEAFKDCLQIVDPLSLGLPFRHTFTNQLHQKSIVLISSSLIKLILVVSSFIGKDSVKCLNKRTLNIVPILMSVYQSEIILLLLFCQKDRSIPF